MLDTLSIIEHNHTTSCNFRSAPEQLGKGWLNERVGGCPAYVRSNLRLLHGYPDIPPAILTHPRAILPSSVYHHTLHSLPPNRHRRRTRCRPSNQPKPGYRNPPSVACITPFILPPSPSTTHFFRNQSRLSV